MKFGSSEGSQWAGGNGRGVGVSLELLEGPEESLRSSYKFMFQRLRDVRNGEIQRGLFRPTGLTQNVVPFYLSAR